MKKNVKSLPYVNSGEGSESPNCGLRHAYPTRSATAIY